MKDTPKGMRLHIGLFGRRNVGKSSLLNALTRQQVSIVSDVPGTTTDPVETDGNACWGWLLIDTAGLTMRAHWASAQSGHGRCSSERT
jgi:small GTP-binding protein